MQISFVISLSLLYSFLLGSFLGFFGCDHLLLFDLLLASLLIFSDCSQLSLIRLWVGFCFVNELHLSCLLYRLLFLSILFGHLLTSLSLHLFLLFLKLFLLQLFVGTGKSQLVEGLSLISFIQCLYQELLKSNEQFVVIFVESFECHHAQFRDKREHVYHRFFAWFHLFEAHLEQLQCLT